MKTSDERQRCDIDVVYWLHTFLMKCLQIQFVEFLVFQTTLHHPNGSGQNSPLACAADWNTWQKCLRMIYSVVMKEIHLFFKFQQKNKYFLLSSGEKLTLSNSFSQLLIEVSKQVC